MKQRIILKFLAFLLGVQGLAHGASGSVIWLGVGDANSNYVVMEDTTTGNKLGTFNTGGNGGVYGMSLFGNQVWIDDASGGISRFDLSGNSLGAIDKFYTFTATAVVGSQFWGFDSQGFVRRYSNTGTFLGQFATHLSSNYVFGMAQVGNSVWIVPNYVSSYGAYTFDLNGNSLGGLLPGIDAGGGIGVSGNVVWSGISGMPRYDFNGNLIGNASNWGNFNSITFTGNEAFVTSMTPAAPSFWLEAYTLNGDLVPDFSQPIGYFESAVLAVPEPESLSLIAIGIVGMLIRRRKCR